VPLIVCIQVFSGIGSKFNGLLRPNYLLKVGLELIQSSTLEALRQPQRLDQGVGRACIPETMLVIHLLLIASLAGCFSVALLWLLSRMLRYVKRCAFSVYNTTWEWDCFDSIYIN